MWQPPRGRTWEPNWSALQAAEIMEIMGEKMPHYVLKNRRSWVSLAAHILGYKYLLMLLA
jgi:membrane-bound lytic murein transglycosylase MltF